MLEVCPTCTDTSAQTAALLADRSINDRLVELRPLVEETCFEFIDVSNFGAKNFLLQNTPDAVVDRVEVWRIRRLQCWRYEVRCLLLQERDGVTCSMCRGTVLLKHKKTCPGITGTCLEVISVLEGCYDSILHSP